MSDLTPDALAPFLVGRPLRCYPAMLSTTADALAWARPGTVDGGVVVADYQVAARGRFGLPWEVTPGRGLGFSLVVRPTLPATREGWLYVAASTAVAGVVGAGATTVWPDEVHVGDERMAAVAVETEAPGADVAWAVLTVLMAHAEPPRGPLLAAVVAAIEAALAAPTDDILDAYTRRCRTLGRRVRARLIPVGPAGVVVEGVAQGCRPDGGLAIEVAPGRRMVVQPQHLGFLDEVGADDDGEPREAG